LDAFLKTAKDYELKIKWAETDQAPETVIVKDSRLAEPKIPPKPRLEDLAAKFNESFKVECPTVLTSRDKVFLRYSQQALDELRALMPKHALPMVISVQRSASKESLNDLDYQLDDEDRENGISIDQITHGEILSSGPYFLLGKIVLQGESIPPIETPAQGFHYLEDVRLISPFDSAATELNILFQWESYEPKPSEVYILSIANSPDLLDKKTNGAGHIHEEIPWNENSIEINLSGKAEKLGITHGNKRGMILFWKVSCWIVHGLKPYRVSSPVRTLIIKS
jgi:hypothetical protein